MPWYLIVIIILVSLSVIVLTVAFFAYKKTFFAAKNRPTPLLPKSVKNSSDKSKFLELMDKMEKVPFEQVYIFSFDGTQLAARYYHIKDGAPLWILFHGYKGAAVRDMCGGFELARENGFNVLVVDERAHGKSGGKTITLGVKERKDVLCWVDYAKKRFDTDICLVGVSMGATSVLMAAEFNPPVKGIIADCPFSSPREIVKKICRDKGVPVTLTYLFVSLGAAIFGGFTLGKCSAVTAAGKTDIPILLLHGEADRFVPPSMSKKIAEHSDATLVTFEGAGHGLSYISDPDKYKKAVIDFLRAANQAYHFLQ